ncbi:MAG TPA: protein phosphatase 2C domain-containing protein [Vicinamibacterales bacterium]|nr:protein phosphatase 2C domain-containing protein [Vicinamibacterales bacterium]
MPIAAALRAAADTNAGLQRDVNEDRIHVDVARGLFLVIDGVGGHAAGGKAADIALTTMRSRLERETGTLADRAREAITLANNEIHRAATLCPDWNGMACVLTLVIVDDRCAAVGHVGDTRLYKIHHDRIDKITRDHSPVGEREDSNELSELEAMRHPRRNEVYRDVGSDPHQPDDPDFIDVREFQFEPDAALLLCSDGLTDLVDSSALYEIITCAAGQPELVVKELIDAANAAGGKDNVSAVYVEGERFASIARREPRAVGETTRRGVASPPLVEDRGTEGSVRRRRRSASHGAAGVAIALTAAAIAGAFLRPWLLGAMFQTPANAPAEVRAATIAVGPGQSITAALERAAAGSVVLVEPGEYRETVALRNNVRIVSRFPRAATIRLSGTASEGDAAVVAAGVAGAELAGFRIVGDAATPLGTGVLMRGSQASLVDIEVTGAVNAAIIVDGTSLATILASDVHDNPGAALTIRSASARVAHNTFMRNGTSERVRRSFIIDQGADPFFTGNIFQDVGRDGLRDPNDGGRARFDRDNWFADAQDVRSPSSPMPRVRQGR